MSHDSPSDVPTPSGGTTPRIALLGGLAVLSLALIWFLRPWFQGLVYGLYTNPTLLLALAVGGAIAVRVFQQYGGGPSETTKTALQLGGVAIVAIVLVTGSVTGVLAGATLGQETMDMATSTDSLSATDPTTPRIVTRSVADRYASNTLNFPQYRVSNSDITVYNGSLYWSYALSPDGAFNHLTKKQHGTVLVDMGQQNAGVTTVEGDLAKGMGTAFYNNHMWATLKRGEYLVNYQDSFMVVHEGEQYIATPYTTPEFHWLPVPYTTPEWGGVALMDSDGTLQDLSPAEARNSTVLEGQRLYPFALARERVRTTKYRKGILNTYTAHEDEIEVAPVPGEGNEQPFLLQTQRGPEYVVAVEPYGEAQGLREVWTVDARTGTYERYSPSESLFGPRKAVDYVRQAARTTDWDRFTPAEPIPVVVDDTLYWQVRVVPDDSSGISYVAFVNARTSDVSEVERTGEVSAFLRGQQVSDQQPETDDQQTRQPTLVVERVAPNGTVLEEMEIYGNESVRVVSNGTEQGE